jgi:hypothetical protein
MTKRSEDTMKRTTLDPGWFRRDMDELAKVSPQDVVEVAVTYRERYNELSNAFEELLSRFGHAYEDDAFTREQLALYIRAVLASVRTQSQDHQYWKGATVYLEWLADGVATTNVGELVQKAAKGNFHDLLPRPDSE